jgi:hypothetical protein
VLPAGSCTIVSTGVAHLGAVEHLSRALVCVEANREVVQAATLDFTTAPAALATAGRVVDAGTRSTLGRERRS